MTTPTLDQRYGRRPRPASSRRTVLVLGAVLVLLATGAVAWYAAYRGHQPTAKEVSYSAGQASTSLDFQLTKDQDQTVTCAVQALNDEHAIVGWKEVTVGRVPAEDLSNSTSAHHVVIRTTSPAHTATVDSCWVDH